ncbi:hypothetical protein BDB01DRAFT_777420 [Pilobolus umbonatus]|nr:hypothetical protein BDB01DRAFT_777420 [Pilobolus umbonatus]
MNIKTAYDILGVGRFTTKQEVRRRYLELCKKHHPDVAHQTGGIDIRDITSAYECLTNKNITSVNSHHWEYESKKRINTQLWTRRSTLLGLGMMTFIVIYLSYDRPTSHRILPHERLAVLNTEEQEKIPHKREVHTMAPWIVSGLSFREWRRT